MSKKEGCSSAAECLPGTEDATPVGVLTTLGSCDTHLLSQDLRGT